MQLLTQLQICIKKMEIYIYTTFAFNQGERNLLLCSTYIFLLVMRVIRTLDLVEGGNDGTKISPVSELNSNIKCAMSLLCRKFTP